MFEFNKMLIRILYKPDGETEVRINSDFEPISKFQFQILKHELEKKISHKNVYNFSTSKLLIFFFSIFLLNVRLVMYILQHIRPIIRYMSLLELYNVHVIYWLN